MSYEPKTMIEGFLWFRFAFGRAESTPRAQHGTPTAYATMRAGPDARIASCTLSGIAESVITVSNPETFMTL